MTQLVLVANAGDATLTTLALHRDPEPRLDVLATTPADYPKVSTFAIDEARDPVYVATADPAIVTLRLDRATGTLTPVARTEVESRLAYVALAEDGTTLLGASYHDGFVASWPIVDGVLGEQTSRFEHANMHSVLAVGDLVYGASLGDDLIAQYRLADGVLTPLNPATVSAPEGSGPRHLIIEGEDLYVVTEFSGELLHYRRADDGTLSLQGSTDVIDPRAGLGKSRYGADPMAEHLIWGADLHRAGAFLLTSERTESTIGSTRIREDGAPGEVVTWTETELQPRGFATTADGKFVVAVGERSTHASLYAVAEDGSLRQVHRAPVGAGANWVRVLR